jgi:uncharacterized membrane protein YhhN
MAYSRTMLAIVVCAVACGALIVAEYRALARLRVIAKLTASVAFVIVGLASAGDSRFAAGIVVGLILGAVGDAALLGAGRRWFLAGLLAFLGGHLAYVVGFAELVPVAGWPAAAHVVAIVPTVIGAVVLAMLWHRLGALRVPVVAYVLVIVAMVVGALAVYRSEALPDPQRTRLLAGAWLFFASDLAVARDRFVARKFANKLWGLPAYYAAQLLIATSIGD